ncbi:DUF4238 domain-containing protein [Mesorhizobium sp. M0136]|uniref:hypothetical protein n=1 Tax=Mesorhizobium sp. M0136 TaxID=2956890 RepID=UPI00333922EC
MKSAQHHWWPEGVSQFWADSDGMTTQLRPDGSALRNSPNKFGSIGNAHHIKLGEPWDHSIEPIFDAADSQFPHLIKRLLAFESKVTLANTQIHDRFLLLDPFSKEETHNLAMCLSSLIVRAPRFRTEIGRTVEELGPIRYENGLPARHYLIPLNIGPSHLGVTKSMEGHGIFIIMYSDEQEFIYGDGFLHNFCAFGDSSYAFGRCIVPITPTMSVVYFTANGSYRSGVRTVRLSRDEVDFFNGVVQIYSKDYIFYRSIKPRVIKSFTDQKFYVYHYHQHEWLEYFLAGAVEARFSRIKPKA